jgi:type I restriction enzyme S subunit
MKNGWQWKPLGELCKTGSGGTPLKDRKEYYDGGTIPWLMSGEVGQGEVWGATRFITQKGLDNSAAKIFPKDTVLVAMYGATAGQVGILRFEAATNQAICGILPSPQFVPEFLFYFLLSKKDELVAQAIGNAQPNISQIKIKNTEAPILPLSEQQQIVSILDQASEGIATATASAEKNLQNARALFASHLEFVFTQRGNGWVESTLGKVCEFIGGSQPPKSVFSKTKTADNIRLIQIRDYKSDNHVVYIPRAQARRFCKADDVMIGRYGPPLFQILRGLEGAYNVALMKAVPDESKLSRDFLFYFLKHSAILQYVIYHSERAAGQIGLTKETLEPYPVALPSLAEQEKVVGTILELEQETKRLATLYERKLATLEALKKSLLHQAFTGQL